MSNIFLKRCHAHTYKYYICLRYVTGTSYHQKKKLLQDVFRPQRRPGKSTELVKRWPAVPNIGRVSEMARSCINQERARSASGFIGGHLTVHEHCVHLTNDMITQLSHNSAPSTPPNTTDNTDSRAQHRATDGMLN